MFFGNNKHEVTEEHVLDGRLIKFKDAKRLCEADEIYLIHGFRDYRGIFVSTYCRK